MTIMQQVSMYYLSPTSESEIMLGKELQIKFAVYTVIANSTDL